MRPRILIITDGPHSGLQSGLKEFDVWTADSSIAHLALREHKYIAIIAEDIPAIAPEVRAFQKSTTTPVLHITTKEAQKPRAQFIRRWILARTKK